MDKPVVIVAGASRGLGAAIALQAAKFGANLVLAARNLDDLEQLAQRICETGAQVVVVRADVTRTEDCERIVNQAVHHYGRVDALVNNMGMIEPLAPLSGVSAEDWNANLAVNLVGPAILTQIALPHLRQVSGRVVNVSSGAAEKSFPGWGVYCAAKAGLNMLTRVLAEEEPAVTTIAIKPGVVDTGMQATVRAQGKKGMPEESHAFFVSLFEKGKLLPPGVPGRVIAYLALNAPHEWTGECLSWNDEKIKAILPAQNSGL
jgi:NAD(P)-dependent dehydrogenase (short-subunit alcohol dehydrogenase family)